MRSLLGLLSGGAIIVLLAAVRGGKAADANGVGCPVVSGGTLTSNPQRIRRGKVLGLELLLNRIDDWGDAEEIHVGFEFPKAHEEGHRRELKRIKAKKTTKQQQQAAKAKAIKAKKARAQPPAAKAQAGGGEEEEHAPFLFRNGNVKPKLVPKAANRPHFEPHDGVLEWHLEKDMAYSAPAYRFLAFGKVEKEWEEDHMEFHAFVHNATGFTCWEDHIEVPVF